MALASRRLPARVAALLLPRWPLQVLARGRPALITGLTAVIAAGTVVAVSAPAEAVGVRPGLTLAEARARATALAIVAEEPADVSLLAALWALLESVSPTVEQARPATFFLDWSGLRAQPTGEADLARHLSAELATTLRLVGQLGIADGPFTAAVAAERRATPDLPAVVPPGGGAAFLAPFDLTILPGLRPLAPPLRALGVHTVGDLARLPRAELVRRFGEPLALAHRLASGQDARPLRPPRPLAERTASRAFAPPETSLDRLLFAALRLVRTLEDELAASRQAARLLRLTLTLAEGAPLTLSLPLLGTAGLGRLTTDALQGRLDGTSLPGPIAQLTVTLAGIGPAGGQQLALLEAGRAARRPRQIEAIARLSAFTDALPVLRLAVQPALLPEQAVTAAPWTPWPVPTPPATREAVPGPIEPGGGVGALVLPGVPGRRWLVPPRSVQVLVEAGRPTAVRDGATWTRLVAIDGPARAVSEWWTSGQPTIDRDYYLVAAAHGVLWVLVEDRRRGDWRLVAELD